MVLFSSIVDWDYFDVAVGIQNYLIRDPDVTTHRANPLKDDEEEKIKNIVVGVEMVRTQFIGVLEKNGFKYSSMIDSYVFSSTVLQAI